MFKEIITVIFTTFLLSISSVCQNTNEEDNQLSFKNYGFTINELGEKEVVVNTTALMMFLQPAEGFSANVNVIIQPFTGTLDYYKEISTRQFEQLHFRVINSFQSGDTLFFEYKGKPRNFLCHFYTKAVLKNNKVYLATGTALDSRWRLDSPRLIIVVNSLKIP